MRKLIFVKHSLPEDELVFGKETAAQAQIRFKCAVEGILKQYPKSNVAIIAHGTVITLFVTLVESIEPFQLWRNLGLPSFVVLSLPGYTVLEVIEKIE